MSVEACLAFCTPAEYQYAGVEYGRVRCLYCDNTIHSPGTQTNATDCNMSCTGNNVEFCGAGDRINIYIHSTLPSAPTPTIVRHLGTWDYKGCYVDIGPRLLTQQITTIASGVTAESCAAACKSAGYGLAGLEYGQECWCDNYLPFGNSALDTECNIPCKANATELCGAGNRLAVYQDST
ncbi:hypothetical protein M413DRAFT_34556, partial [Hebeloma cylindrosporum]